MGSTRGYEGITGQTELRNALQSDQEKASRTPSTEMHRRMQIEPEGVQRINDEIEKDFEGKVEPEVLQQLTSQFSYKTNGISRLGTHPDKLCVANFTSVTQQDILGDMMRADLLKTFNDCRKELELEGKRKGLNKRDQQAYAWHFAMVEWEDQMLVILNNIRKKGVEAVEAKRDKAKAFNGPKENWDQGDLKKLFEKLKKQEINPDHTKLWNLEWVSNHLYDDWLKPREIPNLQALNFLIHARQRSQDFYKEFFAGARQTKSYRGEEKEVAPMQVDEDAQAAREQDKLDKLKAILEGD